MLDEPFEPAILAGTALIVAGGAVLAFDPGRPAGFRVLGVVLALVCAALFAVRDNAVRYFARDVDAPPLDAAAASLLGATVGAAVFVALVRRTGGRRACCAPPCRVRARRAVLACAYGALVAGFDRGGVGVVAPLNATQSLWAVLFAAVAYGAPRRSGGGRCSRRRSSSRRRADRRVPLTSGKRALAQRARATDPLERILPRTP